MSCFIYILDRGNVNFNRITRETRLRGFPDPIRYIFAIIHPMTFESDRVTGARRIALLEKD